MVKTIFRALKRRLPWVIALAIMPIAPGWTQNVTVYSTYKLDSTSKKAFGREVERITGLDAGPPAKLIDRILDHSMTTKIGDWYVLYSPVFELYTFVKESAPGHADKLHVATITMAEKYLNPSDTVKHETDRIVREFKEAQDLIMFWKFIVEKKGHRDFFDIGLGAWPRDNAESTQLDAKIAVYSPVVRMADKDLLSCFSFLVGDSWKSRPELTELAKLDSKVLDRLQPLDFYIENGKSVSVMLGDNVLSHLYVSIDVAKSAAGCQPTHAEFILLGE
jgi:hypothetical protein